MSDHENSTEVLDESKIGVILRAINPLPFPAFLVDENHRVLVVNRLLQAMFGIADQRIPACICKYSFHGKPCPAAECPLEMAKKTSRSVEHEFQEEKTGQWILASVFPTEFTTSDSKAVYLHTARDITETKNAVEQVRQHEENLTALNEILKLSIADLPLNALLEKFLDQLLAIPWLAVEAKGAVFLTRPTENTLEMIVNRGLSSSLIDGCGRVPFGTCLCGHAAETGKIVFSSHLDGRHDRTYQGISDHGHYCIPLRSGSSTLGVICLYLQAGHAENKRTKVFLASVGSALSKILEHKKAIEERESLRDQLLQAQKIEAIGQLASGIAHDFRNKISVVLLSAQAIAQKLPPHAAIMDDLTSILIAAEQASALTRQLLAFGRKQEAHPVPLDLNAVIRTNAQILKRLLPANLSIELRLRENLWPVLLDPVQIDQVIFNLCLNARDAMPEGGTLTIETGHDKADPPDFVVLTVTDTGTGMDAATLSRVFEPFFTTKPHGKGTGLGLSMVHGIVSQNGGFLRIQSQPGRGSTFRVFVPRTERPAPGPAVPVDTEDFTAPTGTETVLLVDDDPIVRLVTMTALKRHGYQVLEVTNGDEALARLRHRSEPVHLLLTDLVMPGLKATELIREGSRLHPEMRTIFMSGYTKSEAVKLRLLLKQDLYLEKPMVLSTMMRLIRKTIGQH